VKSLRSQTGTLLTWERTELWIEGGSSFHLREEKKFQTMWVSRYDRSEHEG
jgi:hypothetical protein